MVRIRFLLLILTCFFIITAKLNSNDFEVKVFSNKENVLVGELFKVSIEAVGTNRFDFAEKPNFDPSIIQIRSEQFMNMSINNGVMTSSFTI